VPRTPSDRARVYALNLRVGMRCNPIGRSDGEGVGCWKEAEATPTVA